MHVDIGTYIKYNNRPEISPYAVFFTLPTFLCEDLSFKEDKAVEKLTNPGKVTVKPLLSFILQKYRVE